MTPPKSKKSAGPENTEGAEGLPTVPANFSLTCRKCSGIVEYDEVGDDEAIACPHCGCVNLHPITAEEG